VFEYIKNPTNWLELWPSLISVEDLQYIISHGGSDSVRPYDLLYWGTGALIVPPTDLYMNCHSQNDYPGGDNWGGKNSLK
ncbi:MAG: hypothetical protein ACFFDT_16235, partial [Candidatus Hodarchaeota archaeon]